MTELLAFLKSLISQPGLSGHELPVRRLIEDEWRPLVDEISASRLGSLHALRRGTAPEPRPRLMLAAHMDAIGLMVTRIVDGFLHVTEIGGIDARVLPGQLVTVHGRKDLPGVVVQPPAHLLPPDQGSGPVALDHLLIDTGLEASQVDRLVRVGDLVSFAQTPVELSDDILSGHSLDNRASVTALTACLQMLQGRQTAWDVWAVATAQEEETLGGALTSGFELQPALAVAIDVTFGASPGSPGHKTFPMGKGITLGWGPNIHPAVFKTFQKLADRLEIPYKTEPMPRHSGTDAHYLQIAGEGIPTMVLGIPLRYMHTPVEIVSMKDIERAGRLLAEFAASLELDFAEKLTWDNE
jgi:putative aminopeptidase FrvX